MEINLSPNFTDQASGISETALTSSSHVSNGSYAAIQPPNHRDVSCEVNGTDEYHNFYQTAQFVTGLIIYPILCVTGIIGNSLSIVVLSHKDMATSTNVYLLALCISDSLKLLNDFLYFIMLVIAQYNPTAATSMTVNVYPYAHYVSKVAISVTAWLTVSVAFDRFVSVCYPSRARSLCTLVRARMVVVAVFSTVILLTIPTALRYKLQSIHDTKTNQTCMEIVLTELGRNSQFMIPYIWVHNFFRGIIPVFILIFLNARIINVLRKERVKGKKFSSRNRITLMLIAMIVLFIVCVSPDAVMSTFFGKGYMEETYLVKAIREITDSLVTFNSAVNFILYCSLSALFRNTFAKLFLGRRFVRSRSGSRQVSNYTAAGYNNHCSGRRKSGGRLSLRMKNAEYTDLSQESPPNENKRLKSNNKTKALEESRNSNGTIHHDNSGVWLGYERNTDLVFEQSGGVWLGPVTSNYNQKAADTGKKQNLNSESDRKISTSTGSKEDSTSDLMPRPELSSNGTSSSGCYSAVDTSDKGSVAEDHNENLHTPNNNSPNNSDSNASVEDKKSSLTSPDSEKKRSSRRLAWKLDNHMSREASPTLPDSANGDPQNDIFPPNTAENGRSNLFTKDSLSGKDRGLLQFVYKDNMAESSLV